MKGGYKLFCVSCGKIPESEISFVDGSCYCKKCYVRHFGGISAKIKRAMGYS